MGYDGCGPMSSWHSRRTRLAALLLIASYSAFSQSARLGNSCDLAAVGAKDTQGFLMFDQELRAAISTQDAVPMALLVRYPLRINEGDHGSYSLNDPAALQSHFAEVFPPAVRAAVLKQKPETVFCTSTGVTYGDGALWIGTTGGRYVIEVINLPGVRGASRPRTVPKIEFVCDAEKHRIVIDGGANGAPRYRAWNKPRPLTETPDLEIPAGTADFEGTDACEYSFWTFVSGTAKYRIEGGRGCASDSSWPQDATGKLGVSVGGKPPLSWWCR